MERKNIKIIYFSLCLGIMFSSIINKVGESYYSNKQAKKENHTSIEYENTGVIEIFEPGKHVVIEKVKSPLNEKIQYQSHPGYKPVGFSTSTYGSLRIKDAGTNIMYINTEPVQANANGRIGDDYYFGEFGIPVDYKKSTQEDLNEKEFAPGEHILSLPVANPTKYDIEYEFHEGYEPVGLAVATYGDEYQTFAGASVLYVNTESVKCEKQEDNKYTEFGSTIEKNKVKEIK